MVEFDLWIEAFIFVGVFLVIMAIPCTLVALMGRKMIFRLGQYPTTSPVIDIGTFFKLVVIEVGTFAALVAFYRFFSAK